MEKAKALDDFETAKRKVIIGMQPLRNYCITLVRLCSAGNISFTEMRAELVKVGVHYKKLREEAIEVESRFFTIKDMDLATRFKDLVGEELRKCKEVGLANLQAETMVEDRISQSKYILCTTKREMVMLPRFSINQKTAYLKYSVWKKQLVSHIVDYEAKYRSTLL